MMKGFLLYTTALAVDTFRFVFILTTPEASVPQRSATDTIIFFITAFELHIKLHVKIITLSIFVSQAYHIELHMDIAESTKSISNKPDPSVQQCNKVLLVHISQIF